MPVEKIFATPLGDLNVDRALIDELADFPLFAVLPEVHRHEHSLEMQLPFVKQAFPEASIVPIIVGMLQDELEICLVAQVLRRYVGEHDLIIVSSDFTHYGPRYEYVPFVRDIAANIRSLDAEAFKSLADSNLNAFIDFRERTHDTICGFYPCSVLLAMLPPGTHGTLLNYRTSRDSFVEDETNSVSYMAVIFSKVGDASSSWRSETKTEYSTTGLSESTKQTLLNLARQTMTEYVLSGSQQKLDLRAAVDDQLASARGVFVTLYSHTAGPGRATRPDGKELRGCIGYIWPIKPLAQAVADNVIGACARDPRFPPVSEEELSRIQIDINVLSPLQRVSSYRNIDVGRHGVVMYKSGHQAVFLPSVATEFGWSLEEMLSQLSIKAGCGHDGWRHGARFDVFESESFAESLPKDNQTDT